MIVTTLNQVFEQIKMTRELEIAFRFLHRDDLASLADGRVELDGDRVYALVQSVTSKPVGQEIELEGHKKYIDIHYLPVGKEIIGWINAGGPEPEGS